MQHLFQSLRVLFAVSYLLPSCVKREAQNTSALKIVGGAPVAHGHPGWSSTVGISVSGMMEGLPNCSGTLIAENLVVTAAHCIKANATDLNLEIYFNNPPLKTATETRKVIESARFPEFGSGFEMYPNFDVAWLKFQGTVPTGFAPIEILTDEKRLVHGSLLSLAGYGRTLLDNNDDPNRGLKMGVQVPLRSVLNSNHARSILLYQTVPGEGACRGDSGGAAYIELDGRWILAGSTIGSLVDCGKGLGFYTFLGAYKNWIEETSKVPLSGSKGQALKVSWGKDYPNSDHFRDWCQSNSLPKSAWIVVNQALVQLQNPAVLNFDCEDAHVALAARPIDTPIRLEGIMPDLKAVRALGGLKALSIAETKTSDLGHLSKVTSLEYIDLSNNKLSSVKELSSLKNLKKLILTGNQLAEKVCPVPDPANSICVF